MQVQIQEECSYIFLAGVGCWLLGVMQREIEGARVAMDRMTSKHITHASQRDPMEGRRGASSSVLFLPRLSISFVISIPVFFSFPLQQLHISATEIREETCRSNASPSSSIVFTRVNEVRVDKRVLRGRRVGFPIEEVEERKKERKKERRKRKENSF